MEFDFFFFFRRIANAPSRFETRDQQNILVVRKPRRPAHGYGTRSQRLSKRTRTEPERRGLSKKQRFDALVKRVVRKVRIWNAVAARSQAPERRFHGVCGRRQSRDDARTTASLDRAHFRYGGYPSYFRGLTERPQPKRESDGSFGISPRAPAPLPRYVFSSIFCFPFLLFAAPRFILSRWRP